MKICLICNEYPPGPHGGIGAMNQILAIELVKKGHFVTVVGLYDSNYCGSEFENDKGVNIFRIFSSLTSKYKIMMGWKKLFSFVKKLEKENKIDLIEIPDSYGWFSIWGKLKTPVLVKTHGANLYFGKILNTKTRKSTAFFEKKLLRNATAVCSVSHFTAKVIKDVFNYNNPIYVIHNGVDINNLNNLKTYNSKDIKIIYSGTLIRKKGVYSLTKAIILLLEKGYSLKVIFNGKDSIDEISKISTKEEIMNLIPKEFLKNFLFNGHVTKESLLNQYYESNIAIFPSYAEAFAMAPLEAMSTGIPVIYTILGSGNELILNFEDGILINPDSPFDIAEAIKYLIENPEKAKLIGEKGKTKILKEFSKEVMVYNTIDLYKQIIFKNENK